eukprot:351002-Chlamydomonas_euryale.AAC.3
MTAAAQSIIVGSDMRPSVTFLCHLTKKYPTAGCWKPLDDVLQCRQIAACYREPFGAMSNLRKQKYFYPARRQLRKTIRPTSRSSSTRCWGTDCFRRDPHLSQRRKRCHPRMVARSIFPTHNVAHEENAQHAVPSSSESDVEPEASSERLTKALNETDVARQAFVRSARRMDH